MPPETDGLSFDVQMDETSLSATKDTASPAESEPQETSVIYQETMEISIDEQETNTIEYDKEQDE